MASDGPRYPGTVATEIGPSGDNDWLTPGNVNADDGNEAQITAATYDAGDHSYRLKATNFGFDAVVPAGAIINGIVVEIDRRCFAGAAEDQEVRLYDSTSTLVGDDKQTASAWPGTSAIATYGSSTDTWNAGLDAADIRSAAFGVALIVLATAANTDIGVDFIRVTVYYSATMALAGTSDGVAAATGALVSSKPLAGLSAAAGSAAGVLRAALRLIGNAAGISTADGTVRSVKPLVGTSAGTSTAAAVLSRIKSLIASATGLATADGTVQVARRLIGGSAGVASLIGVLRSAKPLIGSAAGVATAIGALTVTAGQIALAGISQGIAAVAGSLRSAKPLAGLSGGVSTVAGLLGTLGRSAGSTGPRSRGSTSARP